MNSGSSVALELMELFVKSKMQICTTFLCEIAARSSENALATYDRLTFAKSRYMLGGYRPTMRDADLPKE